MVLIEIANEHSYISQPKFFCLFLSVTSCSASESDRDGLLKLSFRKDPSSGSEI